jgi:hypothetical protein
MDIPNNFKSFFVATLRNRTELGWLMRPMRYLTSRPQYMGCLMGFEPILSEPQSDVLTINTINTEVNVGIEPTPLVLQTKWPPRPN